MTRIQHLLSGNSIAAFLVITFVVSLVSFTLMIKVPGAQTPESATGLPIWLIAIWSPNIAALTIWITNKELVSRIKMAFSIPPFSWWLLLFLIPLLVASVLLLVEVKKGSVIEWSNFELRFLLPLIFINLVMGPLGEELGWRAFLYPILKDKYGWLASTLLVGVIWALWHGPLWFLDSPQSKIPFWAFSINVLLLSILMSIIYNHSQNSLIGVVLLHLTFNISLGIIDILASHSAGRYVVMSLCLYAPIVLVLVGIHEWTSPGDCSLTHK